MCCIVLWFLCSAPVVARDLIGNPAEVLEAAVLNGDPFRPFQEDRGRALQAPVCCVAFIASRCVQYGQTFQPITEEASGSEGIT
jgi:hypothetical protein